MQVYPMDFGMSKAYLLETKAGLGMIDAGPRFAPGRIINKIRELGYAPGALKMVAITHADVDHTGGLAALQTETGAVVAASTVAAQAMADGISSRPINLPRWLLWLMRPMLTYHPVTADRILTPGESLLGELRVLDTAGHTPGHLSYWGPDEKILFSGDSLLPHGDSLDPSLGTFCWDEPQAQHAAEAQMALAPDHVYSGHGIWHAV